MYNVAASFGCHTINRWVPAYTWVEWGLSSQWGRFFLLDSWWIGGTSHCCTKWSKLLVDFYTTLDPCRPVLLHLCVWSHLLGILKPFIPRAVVDGCSFGDFEIVTMLASTCPHHRMPKLYRYYFGSMSSCPIPLHPSIWFNVPSHSRTLCLTCHCWWLAILKLWNSNFCQHLPTITEVCLYMI